MSGLEVRGLTKSFGETQVLQGLDLTVADGITAVLGPSGCGKTTLLRLVAGFLDPDGGTIAMGGRPVAGSGRPVPARSRRVGYVPQEGALFPHLDVAANIGFGLPRAARGGPRVGEMLSLVELPASVARRYPHELSGGQQQRVALARALAPRPDLVLLDEPFSSLDAGLRLTTRRAVVDALAASGTTTLLVTHDQGEALSLAGRVAVMREGVIVQEGRPADLYHRPGDRGIAAFLGEVVDLPARIAGTASGSTSGVRNGTTRMLVRPEQVALTGTADAAVVAEVLAVEFYGFYADVRLRTSDGLGLSARCPGHLAPAIGDRVGVVVTGGPL